MKEHFSFMFSSSSTYSLATLVHTRQLHTPQSCILGPLCSTDFPLPVLHSSILLLFILPIQLVSNTHRTYLPASIPPFIPTPIPSFSGSQLSSCLLAKKSFFRIPRDQLVAFFFEHFSILHTVCEEVFSRFFSASFQDFFSLKKE